MVRQILLVTEGVSEGDLLKKLFNRFCSEKVEIVEEALQKYPEQSFAQKFSLCNRQKFSGRKIKEGF